MMSEVGGECVTTALPWPLTFGEYFGVNKQINGCNNNCLRSETIIHFVRHEVMRLFNSPEEVFKYE